jgi:hypothetical protein
MKKNLLASVVVLFLGLTLAGEAVAISGFIPKQIWYSKEKLIEGEMVEIHTPVWNGENDPVLVKVEFHNHEILLGSREVIIRPQELKDVFISWKVTAGEHLISAKIVSSVVIVGEEKKNVSLRYTETDSDKLEVEKEKKIIEKEVKADDSEPETLISEGLLPEKVTVTINEGYSSVDDFRVRTGDKLSINKDKAKEEVETIKNTDSSKDASIKDKKTEDVVKKPLAYMKLFVFSVLSFIFENKIVFYGLIILVVFFIFKRIFQSFRHK